MIKKIIITFALIIFVLLSSFFYFYTVKEVFTSSLVSFEIKRGSSQKTIFEVLQKKGFTYSYFTYKILLKLSGNGEKIKYGKYIITEAASYSFQDLLAKLAKGGSYTKNVTIPEGIKIKKIAQIMKKELNLDSAKFVKLCESQKILQKFQIPGKSLEGYLYPETYNFNEESSENEVITIMVEKFFQMIKPLLTQINNSKYSLHEIVTLASIIQGEVQVKNEAGLISAVYNNRLNKGMKLQADPTIQYLFDKPRRLYFKHLKIDSKYNTYMYKGLPPGPINNPAYSVIEAALNPAPEPFLYMVAKGNGEHYFNRTLKGHLTDKEKFDEVRKKVKSKNQDNFNN